MPRLANIPATGERPFNLRGLHGNGYGEFFNQDKGFGFITPDDGGQDVFVHVSGVISGGPLRDGSKVSYDLGQDRKTGKSKAENVRAI